MAIIRIGDEIRISRPPGDVYALVADVSAWSDLGESIEAVDRQATGPVSLGERFVMHMKALGMTQAMDSEIVELVPGETIGYRSSGPPPTQMRYLVKEGATEDAAVLRCEVEVEPTGVYLPLSPLIRKLTRDDVKRALRRAREKLEG